MKRWLQARFRAFSRGVQAGVVAVLAYVSTRLYQIHPALGLSFGVAVAWLSVGLVEPKEI